MSESSYKFSTQQFQKGKQYQGGEKKVMRKSLVVLLAFAMVFTMFNAVVFAADEKTDLQRLVDAEVIKGTLSGNTMDDQAFKRQDLAVLMSRMHGAEEEAKNHENTHGFADVSNSDYDGYISWAKEKGYMQGTSEVNFGYDRTATVQHLLTVLLRAIDIDDWDNAVQSALDAGLIGEEVDGNAEAIRGESYAAIAATLDIEVEEGLTLGAKLGLVGWVPEVADISAKAVNVDEIEVSFSTAVDPELEIELKNGLIPYATDNTWNDTNTKVTLKSQFALPGAEYTVSVEGYDDLTVEIEDEKAVSLSIDSLGLENKNDSELAITLKNQYDKSMDLDSVGVITVTAFNSTRGVPVDVTGLELDIKAVSQINDQIVVTVVHKDLSQTKTIPVIAETAAASFVFNQVVPTDEDATRLFKEAEAEIKYTLTNQYGQSIKLPAGTGSKIGGVTFISSDDSIVDPADFEVDSDGKLTFEPKAGKTGKVKITSLVAATGHTNSIEVQIVEKNALKTFKVSAPAGLVVSGEEIELPFTALDEFGLQLEGKDISDDDRKLQSDVLNIQVVGQGSGSVKWHDKDKNKLMLVAGNKGSVTIYVYFKGEHQNTITVNIRDAAEAKRITGVKDLAAIFEKDGEFKLEYKHLVVVDQHNRTIDQDKFGNLGAKIKVELASDDVVKVKASNGTEVTDKTATITSGQNVEFIGLKDSGSVKVTFSIEGVAGSAYSTNLSAIKSSDVKTYELGSIGLLHAPSNQKAEVKITGKTDSGATVNLAPGKISYLTSSNSEIIKVNSDTEIEAVDKGTVTIKAWSGTQELASVEVNASEEARAAASVKFTKDSVYTAADNEDLRDILEVKDQYGQDFAKTGTWTSSDSAKVAVDPTTGVIAKGTGGEVTIGFVSSNGILAKITIEVN